MKNIIVISLLTFGISNANAASVKVTQVKTQKANIEKSTANYECTDTITNHSFTLSVTRVSTLAESMVWGGFFAAGAGFVGALMMETKKGIKWSVMGGMAMLGAGLGAAVSIYNGTTDGDQSMTAQERAAALHELKAAIEDSIDEEYISTNCVTAGAKVGAESTSKRSGNVNVVITN